jgi:N-acetylated-alpha-linked acidic dipeptidase
MIKGWTPRRTIIFAHWDAEEQGAQGSTEWLEDHSQELVDKAVVYIDLHSAIKGLSCLVYRVLYLTVFDRQRNSGCSIESDVPSSLYEHHAKRSPGCGGIWERRILV